MCAHVWYECVYVCVCVMKTEKVYFQRGKGQEKVMGEEQKQNTGLYQYENVLRNPLFCMLALVK